MSTTVAPKVVDQTERYTNEVFPAYTISRVNGADKKPIQIVSGRKFFVEFKSSHHEKIWEACNAGSVVTCAQAYDECPIKAIERTQALMKSDPWAGHKLHWINKLSTVISATPEAHDYFLGLHFGDLVEFEGRTFKLAPDHNRNVKLIEVEA